jgi:hypothetical protein
MSRTRNELSFPMRAWLYIVFETVPYCLAGNVAAGWRAVTFV